MSGLARVRHRSAAGAAAAALCVLPACGGGDATDAAPPMARPLSSAAPAAALQGPRVSGRAEALQIAARGVIAPLYGSALAHAVLVRAFELRENASRTLPPVAAGDEWVLTRIDAQALGGGSAVIEGPIRIAIEAADHAEDLLLRGAAGFVRATLRFEHVALDAAARLDGAIVLEVSRAVVGAGSARRSQADSLSIADGSRTLHWSYLYVDIDAQQVLQALNVVSEVPLDGSETVWLDATLRTPAGRDPASPAATPFPGRYVATGVIGWLDARLTLDLAVDGGWTIAVDNDKDDRVDFVVQASSDEALALMPSL